MIFTLEPHQPIQPEEIAFEVVTFAPSSGGDQSEGSAPTPPSPIDLEDLAALGAPEDLTEVPPETLQPDEVQIDQPDVLEPELALAEPELVEPPAEELPSETEVQPEASPEIQAQEAPPLPEIAPDQPSLEIAELEAPQAEEPEIAELPAPLEELPTPEQSPIEDPLPELAEAEVPEIVEPIEPEPAPELAEVPLAEPAIEEPVQELAEAPTPSPPVVPDRQDVVLPEEPEPLIAAPEPVEPAIEEPRRELAQREVPPQKPDRDVALPEPESRPEPERQIARQNPEPRQAANPQPSAPTNQARQAPPQEPTAPGKIDLVKAIQEQVAPCWRTPPRSSVVLLVTLNRNGSVRKTLLKDRQRAKTDQAFRAMAKGAEAAFLRCGPYRLPREQYAKWRELEVDFHTN